MPCPASPPTDFGHDQGRPSSLSHGTPIAKTAEGGTRPPMAAGMRGIARERSTPAPGRASPTPERCERPVDAPSSTAGDHPGRLAQGPEEKQGLAGRRFGFMVPFLQNCAPELMG